MLVLYLFLIYWLLVFVLERKGILKRYNISAIGPILMIRTKRGGRLLEKVSNGEIRERFWRAYANTGTLLMIISMVFMFVIVVIALIAVFMVRPEPGIIHEPRNWLLIPGLNEFIPMIAWVGFVIALVVHEFSHAILSTVEKIKVKSMGILICLVPIGAFVEPDSEELYGVKEDGDTSVEKDRKSDENESRDANAKKIEVATPSERTRILSAGVMANYCVALVAFLLFFSLLFAVQPVNETVLHVNDVVKGSPAKYLGIEPGMIITMVDGSQVTSVNELNKALALVEQDEFRVTVLDRYGRERRLARDGIEIHGGVMLLDVEESLPAYKAGLEEGMRITKMDDAKITNYDDFFAFMVNTTPGQAIELEVDDKNIITIVLAESPLHENRGFLGVRVPNSALGIAVAEFRAKEYLDGLREMPHAFITLSPGLWLDTWLRLTRLPIAPIPVGFGGFNPVLVHLYEPIGATAIFGDGTFLLIDMLFWIGWINLFVGLFNCLPAIPLDGGHVFKEMLNPLVRLGIKEEKVKEKIVTAITALIAVFIFGSIVLMIAGPFVL